MSISHRVSRRSNPSILPRRHFPKSLLGAALLLGMLGSYSCKDEGVNFVPGEVIVGFVDTVDYNFIQSFLSTMKLTSQSIEADSSYSVWIQVDSGDAYQHAERLLKDTAVRWAVPREYDSGDPRKQYILTSYESSIKISYVMSLIASMRGLSYKATFHSPRYAVVNVKVGQEMFWVRTLKTYPFVSYTELNYITFHPFDE